LAILLHPVVRRRRPGPAAESYPHHTCHSLTHCRSAPRRCEVRLTLDPVQRSIRATTKACRWWDGHHGSNFFLEIEQRRGALLTGLDSVFEQLTWEGFQRHQVEEDQRRRTVAMGRIETRTGVPLGGFLKNCAARVHAHNADINGPRWRQTTNHSLVVSTI